MTDSSSGRALLAILALEPEEGAPLDKEDFGKRPLPTLDARVEKYMRAMRDGDFGAGDPAQARELIPAAMAKDLANGSEGNGEGGGPALFATLTSRFNRARKPSRSGIRASTSVWSHRAVRRTGVFSASAAAPSVRFDRAMGTACDRRGTVRGALNLGAPFAHRYT